MLPPRLERLRISLAAKMSPTERETELKRELDLVADALDATGRSNRTITENLQKSFRQETSAWGGDPGRCYVCGK